MENILREYEVRLLDEKGGVILVIPVIASSEAIAATTAASLAARETAAGYRVTPQKSSRGYRARDEASPAD